MVDLTVCSISGGDVALWALWPGRGLNPGLPYLTSTSNWLSLKEGAHNAPGTWPKYSPEGLQQPGETFLNVSSLAPFVPARLLPTLLPLLPVFSSARWNQLDLAIVLLSIMGITLEEIEMNAALPINPTIIRIMRVLRIARGELLGPLGPLMELAQSWPLALRSTLCGQRLKAGPAPLSPDSISSPFQC